MTRQTPSRSRAASRRNATLSRVRRRHQLLTVFDHLPDGGQALLVHLATDMAQAIRRREAEAARVREATDRQVLVACLSRATPTGNRGRK